MPAQLEPDLRQTRVLSVRMSASPAAPWLARQLVAQWCREWQLPESALDDAVLVVSELVSELVACGAASFTVAASPVQAVLEVSVAGPVSRLPGSQAAGPEDAAVPRADLVEALAAWVDVRLDDEGRTVVAAIPLSRAP